MIKSNHRTSGGLLIFLSSIWAFRNLSITYDYRTHPDILRLFRIPEWILFVQAIIGLIGIGIGIFVAQKKMNVKSGYFIFGLAWLVGLGTEFFLVNF